MTATTNVDQVKLNLVTKAQFDTMVKNPYELYMVTDATVDYSEITNAPSIFTGANGTVAGTSGLVPAPIATDDIKFLKGNGTWKELELSDLQSVSVSNPTTDQVLKFDGTNWVNEEQYALVITNYTI